MTYASNRYPDRDDPMTWLGQIGARASRSSSGQGLEEVGDETVPPVIQNLVVTGSMVRDTYGGDRAIISASWDPVVYDREDTEITTPSDVADVEGYLTSFSTPEGWSREGFTDDTEVTIPDLPMAETITFRVRPQSSTGKKGPYTTATANVSRDSTPPPVPSSPQLVGTVRGAAARWDGSFVGGAAKPSDFQYVIAEMSTDPLFGSGNVVNGGILSEAGQTAVTLFGIGGAFTVFARLVAVDKSGNRSEPSAVTTGGSIVAVAADIGEGAITATALAEHAVTAYAIAQEAVGEFALGEGAVTISKVLDGAITAAKTNLAAIQATGAGAGKLAAEAVWAENVVATGVIIGDHILGRTITAGKIGTEEITADEIHALTITGAKIAGTTIEANNIKTNELTALQIAVDGITADEISTYAMTGKVVTGGVVRTGVSGEDRIELRDETVYDDYLGYNRSIRDSIRWIRGYDSALVAEIRGYMGDIAAYGIHLNADVQLGNLQSTIYQVGRRQGGGSNANVRTRSATFSLTTVSGVVTINFSSAMANLPKAIQVTLFSNYHYWVSARTTSSFSLTVLYPVGHASAGATPGDGTVIAGSYYAEDFL